MRKMIGAVVACLAIAGASACSSATTPPPEGNATLKFLNSSYPTKDISKNGFLPTQTVYGGTVLDGTDGTRVSCSVRRSGSTYEVVAHIENADMTLDVASGDVNQGASMSFFVPGSTLDTLRSVDANNNAGPSCVLKTSQQNTNYVIKPGSIFAGYDCPNVRTPQNLTSSVETQGIFLFTGCDK